MLYFLTPQLMLLHYLAKQKDTEIASFLLKRCMLLCQRTDKMHLCYHLFAVKPPLIRKEIDFVH